MVKQTQTIRSQLAKTVFEFVWSFCGVGTERIKLKHVAYLFWIVYFLTYKDLKVMICISSQKKFFV